MSSPPIVPQLPPPTHSTPADSTPALPIPACFPSEPSPLQTLDAGIQELVDLVKTKSDSIFDTFLRLLALFQAEKQQRQSTSAATKDLIALLPPTARAHVESILYSLPGDTELHPRALRSRETVCRNWHLFPRQLLEYFPGATSRNWYQKLAYLSRHLDFAAALPLLQQARRERTTRPAQEQDESRHQPPYQWRGIPETEHWSVTDITRAATMSGLGDKHSNVTIRRGKKKPASRVERHAAQSEAANVERARNGFESGIGPAMDSLEDAWNGAEFADVEDAGNDPDFGGGAPFGWSPVEGDDGIDIASENDGRYDASPVPAGRRPRVTSSSVSVELGRAQHPEGEEFEMDESFSMRPLPNDAHADVSDLAAIRAKRGRDQLSPSPGPSHGSPRSKTRRASESPTATDATEKPSQVERTTNNPSNIAPRRATAPANQLARHLRLAGDTRFSSLGPNCWLDDIVVNAILKLVCLCKPSTACITSWATASNSGSDWLPDIGAAALDTILLPFHVSGNHWLVCVASPRQRLVWLSLPASSR